MAGLNRWTGGSSSQQLATLGFRELISELEQLTMGSGDGRGGGRLLGWWVGGAKGGRDALLLARKWG